ncbi:helix-turn-helix domain-containing protein [Paraburkholderia sp. GAS348]|uniref:helix-turn-helix domain-containing protein n=1 Tax=Paraburkholderia sp. GAS348 TaxID=3035132 RepID=UPI003D2309AE
MISEIIGNSRFEAFLASIDGDLAARAKSKGCAHCGGTLHSATYPRKPRGLSESADPQSRRHSFCCEACRRRTTPASVRFLGRHVYTGTVVVLVSAMDEGVTNRRVEELGRVLGVHRRTLQRWRHWWRTVFAATPFWSMARANLMPPPDAAALPGGLLERFAGPDAPTRLAQCLRFLAPLYGPYGDHAC